MCWFDRNICIWSKQRSSKWKRKKLNVIILQHNTKMINSDDIKKKKKNLNWPQVLDYPYRILIILGSGSGETNSLFNLISHQSDIDKIYLYAEDLYKAKYQ